MEVHTFKILTNFIATETGEWKWEPVEMAGYTSEGFEDGFQWHLCSSPGCLASFGDCFGKYLRNFPTIFLFEVYTSWIFCDWIVQLLKLNKTRVFFSLFRITLGICSPIVRQTVSVSSLSDNLLFEAECTVKT